MSEPQVIDCTLKPPIYPIVLKSKLQTYSLTPINDAVNKLSQDKHSSNNMDVVIDIQKAYFQP